MAGTMVSNARPPYKPTPNHFAERTRHSVELSSRLETTAGPDGNKLVGLQMSHPMYQYNSTLIQPLPVLPPPSPLYAGSTRVPYANDIAKNSSHPRVSDERWHSGKKNVTLVGKLTPPVTDHTVKSTVSFPHTAITPGGGGLATGCYPTTARTALTVRSPSQKKLFAELGITFCGRVRLSRLRLPTPSAPANELTIRPRPSERKITEGQRLVSRGGVALAWTGAGVLGVPPFPDSEMTTSSIGSSFGVSTL